MTPAQIQQTNEIKDADSRLRHCLNVNCLAKIFRYLSTKDLWTLAEMNDFYQQIIKDSVISQHEIDFTCYQIYAMEFIRKMFEKFGSKVRKFNLRFFNLYDYKYPECLQEFIELIIHHCSIGQLKYVKIEVPTEGADKIINLELPIHFRDVESFTFYGSVFRILWIGGLIPGVRLSVSFSISLRYLFLEDVELDPTFDWTECVNLTEIHLNMVKGFNEQNFLNFLQCRPKLESFYQNSTLGNSMKLIADAMADNCGDQMKVFHDMGEPRLLSPKHYEFYNFLAKFKSLKEICLQSTLLCAGDLISAIAQLSEIDTIEKLTIAHRVTEGPHGGYLMRCNFDESAAKSNVKNFTNLKTIGVDFGTSEYQHDNVCKQTQILITYSSQICSNVEHVILSGRNRRVYNLEYIEFMPKLRKISINECEKYKTPGDAFKLFDSVQKNLQRRTGASEATNNTENFIEIIANERQFQELKKIYGIDSFIKLIEIRRLRGERYKRTVR